MIDKKKCTQCDNPAKMFRGRKRLCYMHDRFDTMRFNAKGQGKKVPTVPMLNDLAAKLIADQMRCPHCKRVTNWTSKQVGRMGVVSLQHDRNGKMRFLCLLCNMRHHRFPADTFYDFPLDWKYCNRCKTPKQREDFYESNRSTETIPGRNAYCKKCHISISSENQKKRIADRKRGES